MAKPIKIIYCPECRKKTVHNYIGFTDDMGATPAAARFLLGIVTLGISAAYAAATRKSHYRCESCGDLRSFLLGQK